MDSIQMLCVKKHGFCTIYWNYKAFRNTVFLDHFPSSRVLRLNCIRQVIQDTLAFLRQSNYFSKHNYKIKLHFLSQT